MMKSPIQIPEDYVQQNEITVGFEPARTGRASLGAQVGLRLPHGDPALLCAHFWCTLGSRWLLQQCERLPFRTRSCNIPLDLENHRAGGHRHGSIRSDCGLQGIPSWPLQHTKVVEWATQGILALRPVLVFPRNDLHEIEWVHRHKVHNYS